MAGVACLGKVAEADEWCDSGLGSLGPDAAAPGGPGLGAELGPGLSWAPLVFGYVTEDGDTALHLAVIHQHEPFLDFLLGFAAGTEYLDLQNDLGQGPDRTSDADRLPVASYPDPDSEKEDDESEEDWKLQLEAENYEGHTPLHVAVIHKDAEMVRLLREAGADLNKPEPTCGRSPLHLAVEAQAADVLELLLRAGADPAARMYGGRTPLGSATLRPNPILARLLRAHGAAEPEDEDDRPGPCSSSSDSDSGDEGDEYDDIVVHSGRGQNRLPPTPASKPLPDDPV
ncbi:nf-kappa-b inhibitor beta isoform 1 [Lynx pardinus]|uniref:Nf-kappa-b inhibitor beta isoform 1 n=1 Tax=Lynx pardinus TaxID=191816 RepID=A0A485NS68_LYNPA|nr:NF-kappa-B inhibitor beta isoform X2 [Lynx canadensis]VFV34924.1 nf-kappa-b inhibitor beta isoform 1 [Lynx pardinus]